MQEYREACLDCETVTDGLCDKHRQKVIGEWKTIIPDRFRNCSEEEFGIPVILKTVADGFLSGNKTITAGYICGETGVGKTTALAVMCNYIFQNSKITKQNQVSPCVWYDDYDLVFKFQWALHGRGEASISDTVNQISLQSKKQIIIIDDIGKGNTKGNLPVDCYGFIINKIYNNTGWVVVTGNLDLNALKDYIGYPATERLIQMCKTSNIEKITGDSKRFL